MLVVFFSVPGATSAHNIWNADNTKVVGTIPDDVWNASVAKGIARMSLVKKVFPPGADVFDILGVKRDVCAWFINMGCVWYEDNE